MTARTPKLVDALLEWRARDRKKQEDAAALLSIARKTYVQLELGGWLPPVRERHFFAHTLHGIEPRLGVALAHACGTTPRALGLPVETKVAAPDDRHAETVYDAAVCVASEAADLPPRTVRAIVAAVVAKLEVAGVTMGQAADLGRAVVSGSAPKSTRGQK
ncbi:MAG TPA: hypothetical protein VGL81_06365 [Polyangiaceae bacterium]|jgi:DNA-binding XRE family transcriptional regulator